MNWQSVYHRVFAVACGLGLWTYSIFCFDLGRIYLPEKNSRTAGQTASWSDQRHWHAVTGAAGYTCMVALLLIGAGVMFLPAPPPTQDQWLKEARFAAAAKLLLIGGGGLFFLGVFLALFLAAGPARSPSLTVQQIQQVVAQHSQAEQRFEATKLIWGALFSVLSAGLLADLTLRYLASRVTAKDAKNL